MMKAGRYYVGDLCYVMSDKWGKVCDQIIDGMNCRDGEFKLDDGTEFACYSTKYGDGEYASSEGDRLCVDAGIIGCVLMDDITDEESLARIADLGSIHEFPYAFPTGHDPRSGEIYIGHVTVYTGDDPDEEEEEEYEYDDEEY